MTSRDLLFTMSSLTCLSKVGFPFIQAFEQYFKRTYLENYITANAMQWKYCLLDYNIVIK